MYTLVKSIIPFIREAGRIALSFHSQSYHVLNVKSKNDGSPVTIADLFVEEYLREKISCLMPGVPIIGEECTTMNIIPSTATFLLDPIDGTKYFLMGNGEFTINIGLVESGVPLLGFIYAPFFDLLFVGGRKTRPFCEERGNKFFLQVSNFNIEKIRLIASHSLQENVFFRWPVYQYIQCGSSLKFCRIASGQADIYPRLGKTGVWDTAAGQAILNAAGGSIILLDKPHQKLKYGNGLINKSFFASNLPEDLARVFLVQILSNI